MTLFREHRIYRYREKDSILYVCLEDFSTGLFGVQQAEFFSFGKDLGKRSAEIARQTLELIAEDPPVERCSWFPTLQAAIESHDKEFGN